MTWLYFIGVHNAAVAMFLALLVWGITRVWKNSPAAHLMWLLVLVKLVTPPLVNYDLGKWGWEPANERGGDFRFAVLPPLVEGSHSPHSPPEIARSGAELTSADDARSSFAPGDNARHALPQLRITLAAVWSAARLVLIGIWIGGAVLIAILAMIRMVRFQQMLAATLPASRRVRSIADELASRMGLRRSPDVRVVDGVVAPFVWCAMGRATMVLPLRLLGALDEQQLAMVLVHELAHLRRRDHWVRMLELSVSVLYWWNPLVWWVRRQLHAVEEKCCDAWVAWVYPDRSRDYAESLLKAAELLPVRSPPMAMVSPFLNTHNLKERIEMVLKNRSQRRVSRRASVALALLAMVVIPAGIRGAAEVRAEQAPAKPPKPGDGVADARAKPVQPPAQEKPLARELQLLQGTFKIERWRRSDKGPAKPAEFETWQWMIKGQEIVWNRPNQEDIRLSFTIDPTASLPRIDLTFLNGPDKGQKCQGVYLASRHKIDICFQNPGAKGERPTNTAAKPGSEQNSMRLVPAEILPVADEVAALEGTWKFDMYYSDWWPERISDPPIRWSKWRWTIKGNEIHWTGMKVPDVKLEFTVDPSKSPRQIDMTFLDGPQKGKKLLGMYEFFAEDACHISFADPDAKVARPTDVAYSTNSGQTMVSIERMARKDSVAATPAPKENVAGRGPEIDAAIARLRKQGAMVREFHPRGNPQYWVQINSDNIDDDDLADVEIIARGVPLYFHLRNSSVTPAGLERLASAGKINQLELSGNNIDDALLKSLPKLPLHGQLGLYSDKLTNAGVQPVAKCLELTSISLEGNLSDESLERLAGLPKLQRVSLGKRFTRRAFDILGRVENLTNLDASELNPDLSDLQKIPKLQTLSLSGKKSGDEAALAIADTFESLESAYLRGTSITNTGVEHLSSLKKLKIFTLDDSLVDDGMADSIRKMKQLTWLSVSNCAVGDDTLAALSECPEMWYVFLVNTRITDKGLAHLPKLKRPLSLYLAECKSVTDAGIKSLAQLPDSGNLHIDLQGSGITEKGARQLQSARPQAQIRWGIPAVPQK